MGKKRSGRQILSWVSSVFLRLVEWLSCLVKVENRLYRILRNGSPYLTEEVTLIIMIMKYGIYRQRYRAGEARVSNSCVHSLIGVVRPINQIDGLSGGLSDIFIIIVESLAELRQGFHRVWANSSQRFC